MQRSKRSGRFDVADGKGVTSRSGTVAVRELADRSGLTQRPVGGRAAGVSGWEVHDAGTVLRGVIVMPVGGGDAFSAIEVLRAFGTTLACAVPRAPIGSHQRSRRLRLPADAHGAHVDDG